MDEQYLQHLLKKYMDNAISKEEYALLMDHLETPGLKEHMNPAMEEAWEEAGAEPPLPGAQQQRLYRQIVNDPRFSKGKVRPMLFSKNRRLQAAACLLVVAGIAMLYPYLNRTSNTAPIAYTERVVPAGKRMKITLADGTSVWVNSGSRIQYPEQFKGETREVLLQGEAYFDVAHNPAQPFVVKTGKVYTVVLGTAFDVKAYGNEVSVTVARGKVSVHEDKKTLGILTPNQQLSYNAQNRNLKQSAVDAQTLAAWKEGELILKDVTIGEAAEIISRWFNVQVNFADAAVEHERVTASFLKGERLENVMEILSKIAGFEYTLKENTITINKRNT